MPSVKSKRRLATELNGRVPVELASVTTNIEFVTPDDAQIYLESNTENYRNHSPALVAKYAADMQAGMWKFDGATICFAEDDVLTDGQHRLQAIHGKKAMDKQTKLKRCSDCRDNFYNGQGAAECWCLADAKPATIWIVGTWQMNPSEHMRPIERLNCWRPNPGTSVMKRG